MMRRAVGMAAVVILGCVLSARAAETVESLQKKIGEQTGKYKTLQYNVHMVTEGAGMPKSVGDGQFQAIRKGDKSLTRMETRSRMTFKAGDQEQTQEYTSTMINDGEYIYTLNDAAGQKMAMKMKPDPRMAGNDPLNSEAAFMAMTKDFNVKVLPDAAVDGKDAWVLELTPKDKDKGGNNPLSRMVTWYDKKTGLPIKSVGYDKDGKVLNTMTISDVKTNVSIPADRFVFKAPPGVEVMDMTKAAGMGGAMPAPQEQTEPAGE